MPTSTQQILILSRRISRRGRLLAVTLPAPPGGAARTTEPTWASSTRGYSWPSISTTRRRRSGAAGWAGDRYEVLHTLKGPGAGVGDVVGDRGGGRTVPRPTVADHHRAVDAEHIRREEMATPVEIGVIRRSSMPMRRMGTRRMSSGVDPAKASGWQPEIRLAQWGLSSFGPRCVNRPH